MWFDLMETLDEVHVDVDSLLLASGRSLRLAPHSYVHADTLERRHHYEAISSQRSGRPDRPVLRR